MTNDTNANASSQYEPVGSVSKDEASSHATGEGASRNIGSGNSDAGNSGEQLYRIREILFGEQMSAQQQRVEQLEANMSRDFSALRDDLTRLIESVENRLLRKVEDVAQQLGTERDRTEEGLQSIGRQIEERVEGVAQALQTEITHQTQSLQTRLDGRMDEINETLNYEANERKTSADTERANLSALFANLSQQLHPLQEQSQSDQSQPDQSQPDQSQPDLADSSSEESSS